MRDISGSYVLRVLFATTTQANGIETVARRWHRLATSSFRPERHYMRGPGQIWRNMHLR